MALTSVRWHGRGGQGCFTVARLLGAAAVHDGRQALAFPSFGPERRGAPVIGHTRLDDQPIHDRAAVIKPDAVVLLDDTLLAPAVWSGLGNGGLLLVNAPEEAALSALPGLRLVRFDATALALKVLGRPIANTALLGALVALTRFVTLAAVEAAVSADLKPALRAQNLDLLRESHRRFADA
jgi:pyruvate ferredoxin oxidoreductase gamma subunit